MLPYENVSLFSICLAQNRYYFARCVCSFILPRSQLNVCVCVVLFMVFASMSMCLDYKAINVFTSFHSLCRSFLATLRLRRVSSLVCCCYFFFWCIRIDNHLIHEQITFTIQHARIAIHFIEFQFHHQISSVSKYNTTKLFLSFSTYAVYVGAYCRFREFEHLCLLFSATKINQTVPNPIHVVAIFDD